MIVVQLHGGLGNQLFQYAVGRSLALKSGAQLLIDRNVFKTYKVHKYGLSPFCIEEKFYKRRFWQRKLPKIEEGGFRFDPNILDVQGPAYLEGFWQTEKYFADVADQIREDLAVQSRQTGRDLELAKQMADTNSVSLHVRRGDYVSNPGANKVHGLCSLDYYRRAVDQFGDDIHLFLFSDDPNWVKENLAFDHPLTVVDHNGPERNYEDLRLMSQCKHHILANSTFSWWGAWLNPSKEKRIYAPKQWFAKEEIDTRDLLPAGWQTL